MPRPVSVAQLTDWTHARCHAVVLGYGDRHPTLIGWLEVALLELRFQEDAAAEAGKCVIGLALLDATFPEASAAACRVLWQRSN